MTVTLAQDVASISSPEDDTARFVGFLAYLSRFAFTATHAKVGELLRIRYFARMGVSHAHVVSCVVFERLMDILVFASRIATTAPGFAVSLTLLAVILAGVLLTACLARLAA